MDKEVIVVRTGKVILFSKNLILIKHNAGAVIKAEDAEEQVFLAKQLSRGNDYAVLLDGGEILDIEDKGMNIVSKHVDEKWKAFAIVVRSLSDRLFANYYLYFTKPMRPTQVFTTPAGAEKWLKQYIYIDYPIEYKL